MTGRSVITETVSQEENGVRLDRWIKRRMSVPQSHLEKLLRTGQIRIDGRRAKAGIRLEAGMRVCLPPFVGESPAKKPPTHQPGSPAGRFLRRLVIHEDEHMFVLNKPAGIAVQGGTRQGARHIDGMLDALGNGVCRPRLVHRLDKETSGLLIVARNLRAAAHLSQLFKARKVDKTYWAITVGVPRPENDRICNWIRKGTGPGGRERMVTGRPDDGQSKQAVTDYAVITRLDHNMAWMALKPQTGRMHQLRLHMHQCGASILGDEKYWSGRPVPDGFDAGLHLHARAVSIPWPDIANPLTIQAPLSGHMQQSFRTLGLAEPKAGHDRLDAFR